MPSLTPAQAQMIQIAAKSLANALADAYNDAHKGMKSTLIPTPTREDYWKKRLKLTGIQSVDDYVQGLVSKEVKDGAAVVATVVKNVKTTLGI